MFYVLPVGVINDDDDDDDDDDCGRNHGRKRRVCRQSTSLLCFDYRLAVAAWRQTAGASHQCQQPEQVPENM